jgi:hypothetical protein
LYIDGSLFTANAIAGTLQFRNNIVAGCNTKFRSNAAWTDSTVWNALSTVNTILDSAQKVMMADPNKFSTSVSSPAGRPNYLLQAGSPANSGADFTGLNGFQNVTYRGAFDGSNDWTQGWATFDAEATAY